MEIYFKISLLYIFQIHHILWRNSKDKAFIIQKKIVRRRTGIINQSDVEKYFKNLIYFPLTVNSYFDYCHCTLFFFS